MRVKDGLTTTKYIYFKDKYLGLLYIEDSGYYVFQPYSTTGYWEAHSLQWIADKLNELNKDWDEKQPR